MCQERYLNAAIDVYRLKPNLTILNLDLSLSRQNHSDLNVRKLAEWLR